MKYIVNHNTYIKIGFLLTHLSNVRFEYATGLSDIQFVSSLP